MGRQQDAAPSLPAAEPSPPAGGPEKAQSEEHCPGQCLLFCVFLDCRGPLSPPWTSVCWSGSAPHEGHVLQCLLQAAAAAKRSIFLICFAVLSTLPVLSLFPLL